MNDDTHDRPPGSDRPPGDPGERSHQLREVERRIDETENELSRVRRSLNRVRNRKIRELQRTSAPSDVSEQHKVASDFQRLNDEENACGAMIREMEKVLSDLWSHKRQLEGRPLATRTPSKLEAEEQRLRWLLLDIKDKQLEAARDWQDSGSEAERARQEARFNELRDQYNAVYEKLNEVREARQNEG